MFSMKLKVIHKKGGHWDYQCFHYIETILLICSENQWGSLYVMETLA